MAMQSMSAQCYMPGPGVDVSDPALGVRTYISEIVRALASQKHAVTLPSCVSFYSWFCGLHGTRCGREVAVVRRVECAAFFHDTFHSASLPHLYSSDFAVVPRVSLLCFELYSAYLFRLEMQTTIMAVEYDGGVVMGADSRTSSGSYIANRVSDKITYVHDKVFFLFCSRVFRV